MTILVMCDAFGYEHEHCFLQLANNVSMFDPCLLSVCMYACDIIDTNII